MRSTELAETCPVAPQPVARAILGQKDAEGAASPLTYYGPAWDGFTGRALLQAFSCTVEGWKEDINALFTALEARFQEERLASAWPESYDLFTLNLFRADLARECARRCPDLEGHIWARARRPVVFPPSPAPHLSALGRAIEEAVEEVGRRVQAQ